MFDLLFSALLAEKKKEDTDQRLITMPSVGGPVYQPTTVAYEPRSGGNGLSGGVIGIGSGVGGGGLHFLGPVSASLGVDSPLRIFRKPRPQLAFLFCAILVLITGLAMVVSSLLDWKDTTTPVSFEINEHKSTETVLTNPDVIQEHTTQTKSLDDPLADHNLPLGVLLGGIFFVVLGIIGLGKNAKLSYLLHTLILFVYCRHLLENVRLASNLRMFLSIL